MMQIYRMPFSFGEIFNNVVDSILSSSAATYIASSAIYTAFLIAVIVILVVYFYAPETHTDQIKTGLWIFAIIAFSLAAYTKVLKTSTISSRHSDIFGMGSAPSPYRVKVGATDYDEVFESSRDAGPRDTGPRDTGPRDNIHAYTGDGWQPPHTPVSILANSTTKI